MRDLVLSMDLRCHFLTLTNFPVRSEIMNSSLCQLSPESFTSFGHQFAAQSQVYEVIVV